MNNSIEVKITDFGLSRPNDTSSTMTPGYTPHTAPEVEREDGRYIYNEATDGTESESHSK